MTVEGLVDRMTDKDRQNDIADELTPSQTYKDLLDGFSARFPISSPSKGPGPNSARDLALKEGGAIQEQYGLIQEDIARLISL